MGEGDEMSDDWFLILRGIKPSKLYKAMRELTIVAEEYPHGLGTPESDKLKRKANKLLRLLKLGTHEELEAEMETK